MDWDKMRTSEEKVEIEESNIRCTLTSNIANQGFPMIKIGSGLRRRTSKMRVLDFSNVSKDLNDRFLMLKEQQKEQLFARGPILSIGNMNGTTAMMNSRSKRNSLAVVNRRTVGTGAGISKDQIVRRSMNYCRPHMSKGTPFNRITDDRLSFLRPSFSSRGLTAKKLLGNSTHRLSVRSVLSTIDWDNLSSCSSNEGDNLSSCSSDEGDGVLPFILQEV